MIAKIAYAVQLKIKTSTTQVLHFTPLTRLRVNRHQRTLRKNARKLRYVFCLQIFQASWAKNYDLLRVIAVHGTMTIKFYVEF